MNGPATYVYCVFRGAEAPPLEGAPAGLDGAGPARALAVDDGLWLVVADAPAARYSVEAIERGLQDLDWVGGRAIEHEALVEHVLAAGTVVPMKLFTQYLGDERAVTDLRARRAELDRLLDTVEGKREWGLRILVDPERAAAAAVADAADDGATAGPASDGKSFLMRKQRELGASRKLRSGLLELADGLHDELSRLASDARTRAPAVGEGRLLLDASFLVAEARTTDFHAAIEARAEALRRRGLELSVTGPWPPYNFVEPAR